MRLGLNACAVLLGSMFTIVSSASIAKVAPPQSGLLNLKKPDQAQPAKTTLKPKPPKQKSVKKKHEHQKMSQHHKKHHSKHHKHVVVSSDQKLEMHLQAFENAVDDKNWDMVEQHKHAILKYAQKDPHLYNSLGYALIDRSRQVEEGLALVEKTLAIEPTEINALDSKAWAYSKLGKHAEAKPILAGIVAKFEPGSYNYAEVYSHYAFVLYQLGEYEEAEKNWKIAQTDQPTHPVVLRVGQQLGFLASENAQ